MKQFLPTWMTKKAGIFLLFLGIGMVILLCLVKEILLPFLLGIFIAYLVVPLVQKLTALDVPDTVAILVIFSYLLILAAMLLFLCLPMFVRQTLELIRILPDLLESLKDMGTGWIEDLPAWFTLPFENWAQEMWANLGATFQNFSLQIPVLLTTAFYAVLGPILAFYLLKRRDVLYRNFSALLSPTSKKETFRVLDEMNGLIRRFVSGYLLTSGIMAILSVILYFLIGLDYAFVLGVVMGIADLIPYFGPFLGAVPALIIALQEGTSHFVLTGLGILLLQQLESSVITPKIMGEQIGLGPFLTIFVVLGGTHLFGVFGAIFAVPLAGVLLFIIRYLYEEMVGANPEKF